MVRRTIPAVVVPGSRKSTVPSVQTVAVEPFQWGGINAGAERFEVLETVRT